jgi:hypothetical protein
MSLIVVAAESLVLYLGLVATHIFTLMTTAFIVLASAGIIFLIRYVVISLSQFIREVNHI